MSKNLLKLVCALATLSVAALKTTLADDGPLPGSKQESTVGITHSFLANGGETYILGDDNKVIWKYPRDTRDGFVLPNGNILLAVSRCGEYPSGAVVEITRDDKVVFEYKGTQSEVNTVSKTSDDHYVLTEAGAKPRVLEVDKDGKIIVEMAITAQTHDLHLQSRMTRKLANGNYLVPQLLDKVVREYSPDGKIVWEAKTPESPAECWPFTAIRVPSGNTLIDCTHGLISIEVDKDSKIVWQLTNADLPSPMLKDPCGAQRLPNGNTVITSYGQGAPGEIKMLEVTPEKKVVWTYRDDKHHGIHEFQILDTNGVPVPGIPMK